MAGSVQPNTAEPGEIDDLLQEAKEAFKLCEDAEDDNRREALDDIKFARLEEQWPATILKKRQDEGRPCLTLNQLPAFIRQVVNDARQNRPAIKVHPVDSQSDPETAEIINGLIRAIEVQSKADIAYDTAVEFAVTMGFGYLRVNTRYADDDTFDLDLCIDRVANPFSVYGDPMATSADGSDWNVAFVTDKITKDAFERKWKGAQAVDWSDDYRDVAQPWLETETVMVAEWWTREEVPRTILLLSDNQVIGSDVWDEQGDFLQALGVSVVGQRDVRSHKVTQRIITGAEVLEERDWPGRYIPIVPVYGEEINVEGRRYFRSLIRSAKDAQRMFNYWRTTGTELVALAPRVPYIGPKGAFNTDSKKWTSANTDSWPYLQYDGQVAPQRQPLDFGGAAGAMQEAMNSAQDMQRIMGIYNASLGAPSTEVSGIAINARKVEGDVSNFHFIDNLTRGIQQLGHVLIDLIPTVYKAPRMLRVLGQERQQLPPVQLQPRQLPNGTLAPVAQPAPNAMPQTDGTYAPQDLVKVFDLTVGKYDVTVETGPSFTTRREEAASQMMQLIQAYPQCAPVIGDLVAKNLDWPGADIIAQRLQSLLPPAAQGVNPMVAQLQQTLKQVEAQGMQAINQLKAELASAKAQNDLKTKELEIDAYQAETDRLKVIYPKGVVVDPLTGGFVQATDQAALNPPDLVSTVTGGPIAPPVPGMGGAQGAVQAPGPSMGSIPHPGAAGPVQNAPGPPVAPPMPQPPTPGPMQ
jgi:hypothetical protein